MAGFELNEKGEKIGGIKNLSNWDVGDAFEMRKTPEKAEFGEIWSPKGSVKLETAVRSPNIKTQ